MPTPRPVLLDCDPGHDDAVAILLAAGRPDAIGLRAVTTVGGNAELEKVTLNARRVLTLAGVTDVPVAAGAAGPRRGDLMTALDVHGQSGLDGAELPEPAMELDPRAAVELMVDRGPATVVATGPLTNVAELLERSPDTVQEIVWMGGSTGRGNTRPYAEFNALVDPEAAEIVFASGKPLTMVGLNLTHQAQATPEVVERLRAVGNPAAEATVGLAVILRRHLPHGLRLRGAAGARRVRGGAAHRPLARAQRRDLRRHRDRGALDARGHGRRPARAPGAWRPTPVSPWSSTSTASGTSSSERSRRCDRRRRLDQPRPGGRRRAPPGAGRDRRRGRLPRSFRAARAPTRRWPRRAWGREVAMVGRVGADAQGAWLREGLWTEGVDVEHVREDRQAPTGVALIAVDARGENTIVVSPGANARVDARDVAAASEVVRGAEVVLVQHEVPQEAVAAAIATAGGTVVLNPAPARGLAAPVDVLVPNRGELETLAGGRGDPVTLARSITAARAVVVTLGAEGAVVVEGDRAERVRAPQVEAVDTTGAGDAFCELTAVGDEHVHLARRARARARD